MDELTFWENKMHPSPATAATQVNWVIYGEVVETGNWKDISSAVNHVEPCNLSSRGFNDHV